MTVCILADIMELDELVGWKYQKKGDEDMKRFGRLALFVVSLVLLIGLLIVPAQAADQSDDIVITAPGAGANVRSGSNYEIKWSAPAAIFAHTWELQYSVDGGANWIDIDEINGPASSYTWAVPNITTNSAVVRVTFHMPSPFPPIAAVHLYNDSEVFAIKPLILPPLDPIIPIDPILPIDPPIILPMAPVAPSNLDAEDISSNKVELTWDDNSGNETGFRLERAKGTSGSFTLLVNLGQNVQTYSDASVEAETTYKYRIRAYNTFGNSTYSDVLTVKTEAEADDSDDSDGDTDVDDDDDDTEVPESVNLLFVIGSKSYKWNGTSQAMDVAPIIRESRTLLPIRYVADPLGANVLWNSSEGKVTVQPESKTIELWINNNTAKVNGNSVKIDPNNNAVTPIIIPPGRTMLPLRFIADNLDSNVVWNPADTSINVTYPK
jgi:hypothetical protein